MERIWSGLRRAVLRAYPRHVRERHGAELEAFWRSQASEPRYAGRLGRARLAAQVAADALAAGLRMRWTTTREGEPMGWDLTTDLRFARRSLTGAPLFTVVAVVTIALGIAASTAVFAVVDSVMLRSLPYPDADRLVRVLRTAEPGATVAVAWPDFRDWREQATGFDGLIAYAETSGAFEWEGGAESIFGARVTRDFFEVMGVPLVLGRTFTPGEDEAGGPRAIVISHRLWLSRFDGDPDVTSRTVPLSGELVPIVGVAAEGFEAPLVGTRYWLPMQGDQLLGDAGLPMGTRGLAFQNVVGRLAEGTDPALAEEGLRALAHRIDVEVGKADEQLSEVRLVPLRTWLVGDTRRTLVFLLGSALLVLVVSGANVAGLALSRSAGRARELSVRAALGAGRSRLLRQLLVEAAVLCAAAGVMGLGLAWTLVGALVALAPPGLPRVAEVGLSPAAVGFAAALAVASAVVVGLIPALRASRADATATVAGVRGGEARSSLRAQGALVSFQVATAFVLLVGATLLANSYVRLVSVERGFDAESVVVASVEPPESRSTPDAVSGFYEALLERVRALPGVVGATTTYSPPLFRNDFSSRVRTEGDEESEGFWAVTVVVGADYFRTNGVRLLAGRDFRRADRLETEPVLIVNETLAERIWPGADPIGMRLVFSDGVRGSLGSFDRRFFPREPMTVVGVAADVRQTSLGEEPGPAIYRPHAQITWGYQYLLVRTSDASAAVTGSLRDVVWEVDPGATVREVTTLDARVSESVATERFRVLLLAAFALATGVLSMIGLYAVMALAVARRVREMGIRIALGASRAHVARRTLGLGLRLVGLGAAIGLVASWAASRTLSTMLFGIEPTDPLTYVLVLGVTGIVGAAACYGPARRAGRVDPVTSLQQE